MLSWAFDGSPGIIDVYVRPLREALGARAQRPSIETIRSAGYPAQDLQGSRQEEAARRMDEMHPGAA